MPDHFVHDLAIIMAKNNGWFNGRDNGRNSHFHGFSAPVGSAGYHISN
jgi:hypothetical protein